MTETPFDTVWRRDAPRARARLVRELGDFDLAEDMLQDALVKAVERWPVEGVPEHPAAWLVTVAKRAAIDAFRRRAVHERVVAELPEPVARAHDDGFGDDWLRLIFTCCHPGLGLEAQVALTLRTVVGLELAEIANAFLVSERSMEQRLVRAKRKIRAAGIPFEIPGPDDLDKRLDGVLTVVYLVFNEGYSATTGDRLLRRDLCANAIALARSVNALMRGRAEVLGLLALMLLQHSRAETRVDEAGRIVLLEDQDRTRWNRRAIREGTVLLEKALLLRQTPGPFQLQAAIAANHANAPTASATDWEDIAALYGELLRVQPTTVVKLNRAVALGMARGPEAGLAELDALAHHREMAGFHLFHSARAGLLKRAGRGADARHAYVRALGLARNTIEREFLNRQIAMLDGG